LEVWPSATFSTSSSTSSFPGMEAVTRPLAAASGGLLADPSPLPTVGVTRASLLSR
jgi:hypothetical protein